MKKEGLTAKQVEHMKPGAKRVEVPAWPPKGLFLVVHPSGKKSWMFRYRYRGRTRGMTLSEAYPDLTLATARAEAEAALELLDQDIDPAVAQVIEEQEAAPNSAESVAKEWIDRYVKPNTDTWKEVKRILDRDVVPNWKDRYIDEIARPDVLRLLDKLVDRGAPVLANRTLSILKRWFRWCVERGYIQTAPTAGIRPPSKEQSRDRVLTPEELTAIWKATPALGFPFGEYFRILILTAQRRGEVANMEWSHVELKGEAPMWTLPREATKAGRIHDVPLSPAAHTLLKEAPHFKGKFVFTTTSGKRPISGFSKAKESLDKEIIKQRKEAAVKAGRDPEKVKGLQQWGLHDLRRTCATWLAERGFPPHVVAAILNHTPGSTMGITAIYARHRYTKERREALQSWADYVGKIGEKREKATA